MNTAPSASYFFSHFVSNFLVKREPFLYLAGTILSFFFFLWAGYETFYIDKKSSLTLFETLWFEVGAWQFSLHFALHLQNFLLVLAVLLISFSVQLYSFYYISQKSYKKEYFRWLFFFSICMIALLLSQDLLLLFCFWELLGLCSFALIALENGREGLQGRKATEVFLYNRVADIAFIAALAFLVFHFKTTNLLIINDLLKTSSLFYQQTNFFWLSIALMIAAFGKSAQVPFSLWLPKAMVAPTPVSALLHAATMVASGIFLLTQVFFILDKNALELLLWIGFLTLLLGNLFALFSPKIKGVLAGSTVAQLALMVLALSLASPLVALFHLLTHAFFKALLFLVAGSLMKKTGQDKLENLKGIFHKKWKQSKMLIVAFFFAAYSLLGLPLSAAFLSKEALMGLFWQEKGLFFTLVFMILNLLSALYLGRLASYLWAREGKSLHFTLKTTSYEKISFLILLVFCSFLPFSFSPFHSPDWVSVTFEVDLPIWIIILNTILNILIFAVAFFLIDWKKIEKLHLKISMFYGTIEQTIYTFLQKISYYFDYIDDKILATVPLRLAFLQVRLSYLMREKVETILTKQPENLGKTQVVWGYLMSWIDKYFVDAFVLLFSLFWKKMSWTLGLWQTKRVQFYLLWGFVLLILMIFIFIFKNKI